MIETDKTYTDQEFMRYLKKYFICNVYLNIVLRIPSIMTLPTTAVFGTWRKSYYSQNSFKMSIVWNKNDIVSKTFLSNSPKDKHFSDRKCHDHKIV